MGKAMKAAVPFGLFLAGTVWNRQAMTTCLGQQPAESVIMRAVNRATIIAIIAYALGVWAGKKMG